MEIEILNLIHTDLVEVSNSKLFPTIFRFNAVWLVIVISRLPHQFPLQSCQHNKRLRPPSWVWHHLIISKMKYPLYGQTYMHMYLKKLHKQIQLYFINMRRNNVFVARDRVGCATNRTKQTKTSGKVRLPNSAKVLVLAHMCTRVWVCTLIGLLKKLLSICQSGWKEIQNI